MYQPTLNDYFLLAEALRDKIFKNYITQEFKYAHNLNITAEDIKNNLSYHGFITEAMCSSSLRA